MILRLPPCLWAKWQVLWDLTEIKSQLLASKCYYERETIVQLAAWVSLLFSLVHPHQVLDAVLSWVPAQAILVPHAGLAKLLLCIGSSHTQSCSQRTSNLLEPAVLHKSQNPGVDQDFARVWSTWRPFLTTMPQSWAVKSISEILIRLNFKEKSLNCLLLWCFSLS